MAHSGPQLAGMELISAEYSVRSLRFLESIQPTVWDSLKIVSGLHSFIYLNLLAIIYFHIFAADCNYSFIYAI
jgi:hypothetical protein